VACAVRGCQLPSNDCGPRGAGRPSSVWEPGGSSIEIVVPGRRALQCERPTQCRDATAGEAVFAPAEPDAAEDDGYVMAFAHNPDRGAAGSARSRRFRASFAHEHERGFAFEVLVRLAADVDRNPVDGAAG
jgi:Retinal pigment epithelial membrane protein